MPPYPADVLRALVTDLDGLADACASVARAQRGELARARADLTAALTHAPGPAQAAALHIHLAVVAARDGDADTALAHAREAVGGDDAIVLRDILRARPELAEYQETPAWQALLGRDDRTLVVR